ncbi:DUF7674 family protein [Hymenobacter crusticola]|uniref:DUF7674 domain-containing protein n=1 Tax=Hymenobacter crusticola TaxID=1770526 RepID=A0A243WAA3_9BACT|nr:hypothetical protein [Hymenobacter crusticola]OUJ72299.1 hypothetical protein BXP70_18750 [Hymenobacter crusticola]
MMASSQLSALLVQHIPALEHELPGCNQPAALPDLLAAFAAYTRHVALTGRLPQLRACLVLANQLLQLNDPALTAAVLHGYLPALHLAELPQDPQLLEQFMPRPLSQACARR